MPLVSAFSAPLREEFGPAYSLLAPTVWLKLRGLPQIMLGCYYKVLYINSNREIAVTIS